MKRSAIKPILTFAVLSVVTAGIWYISPAGTRWRIRRMDTPTLTSWTAQHQHDVSALEELAARLEQQGLDEAAMAAYIQAAQARPGEAGFWVRAASIALRRGDREEAQRCADEAARAQPGSAAAHVILGDVYARNHAWDKARQNYVAATELDGHSLSAWLGMAQTSLETKDFAGAGLAAKKATEMAPQNASAWFFLGRAFRAEGNEKGALNALNRARQLAPDDPQMLLEWGEINAQRVEDPTALQEAEHTFQQAQRLLATSPDAYSPAFHLGMLYLAQKRYADAEAQFQSALRSQPEADGATFGLLRAYSFEGKHTQAQNLERRFQRLRENRLAISQLQMRLAREPNRVDLLPRLAERYKAVGDAIHYTEIQARIRQTRQELGKKQMEQK